jgi:hypothetical protein
VFVSDAGEVALTGFGVAQSLMTVGLQAPFRRPYSAPERDREQEWDRRADIYSLAAIARAILATTAAPPAAISSVLARGLADDPAARFGTAQAFVEALTQATAITPAASSSAAGATSSAPRPSEIEFGKSPDVSWEPDPIGDAPLRSLEAPAFMPDPVAPPEIVDATSIGVTMRERHPVIAPRFPWMALIAASFACLAAGGLIGYRLGFSRGSDARIVSDLARVAAPTPAVTKETAPAKEAPAQPLEAPATPTAVETPSVAPGSQAASAGSRRDSAVSKASAGSIEVDSRPRGARVVVDGRPVGQTPLKVTSVSPGDLRVLIALTGHRRVTSTVKVVAGEQARMAVSLEQTGGSTGAPRKRK